MTSIQKASDKITLSDIKANFPLPGSYLFRFKSRHNKTPVYMDVLKEGERLPHFDQKIVVKVARLSFGAPAHPSNSGPAEPARTAPAAPRPPSPHGESSLL